MAADDVGPIVATELGLQRLDGTVIMTDPLGGVPPITGLAVKDWNLYFTRADGVRRVSARTVGQGYPPPWQAATNARLPAILDPRTYWVEAHAGGDIIYSLNVLGGAASALNAGSISDLTFDARAVFFLTAGQVLEYDFARGGPHALGPGGIGAVGGIAVAAGCVYFAANVGGVDGVYAIVED
jgi:hypothetical protein